MGNVKAQLFKTSKGFYLQELPKKGAGGAQCEMTIGSTWGEGDKLSLKNCEAIENDYDLDEISLSLRKEFEIKYNVGKDIPTRDGYIIRGLDYQAGVIHGFHKALEIIGDKKFSISDMEKLMFATIEFTEQEEGETYLFLKNYIQSLQQTEWDVEIELICPHPSDTYVCGMQYGCDGDGCNHPEQIPYLDSGGCLILKRI